jgi:hypothetical protein
MDFEITEIKMLGHGLGRSLSLRLDAVSNAMSASSGFSKSAYTIHAVVPFSPEFGNIQVGQKFKFERVDDTVELARAEMRKALPVIIELLGDTKFVNEVNKQGYQFDAAAIFNAFTDATGWKTDIEPVQKMTEAERRLFLKDHGVNVKKGERV